jgi:hypothetical protein
MLPTESIFLEQESRLLAVSTSAKQWPDRADYRQLCAVFGSSGNKLPEYNYSTDV